MMYYRFSGIPIAATALTLLAQPGWAAPTQVTAIQLKPTAKGIELTLNTQGNRPPVFTVSRGKSTVADITNSQLRLPGSKSWRQNNPAPGIASVVVSQIEANTVRAVVNGSITAPTGRVRRSGPGVTLNFDRTTVAQTQTPARSQTSSPKPTPNLVPPLLPRAVAPPVGDISVAPLELKPDTVDLGTSERIPKLLLREAPVQEVLTLLARAAGVNLIYIPAGSTPAKPAIPSQTKTTSEDPENGDTESVTTSEEAKPPEPAGQVDTISLDIEDEPVQDVFNYVLQVTGLQANRVGKTIFVGRSLPGAAQNRVVRTFRLNQIKATAKTTIIDTTTSTAQTGGSASGASGSAEISEEGGTFSATGESSSLAVTALNRGTKTTDVIRSFGAKEILQSYGANAGGKESGGGQGANGDGEVSAGGEESGGGQGANGTNNDGAQGASSSLLRGLEVVADARANTITLIGSPRVVEIGTSLLMQMDARRRQAAIAVKILDVDLLKERNANADINFNSTNTIASGFINGVFQIGSVLGNNFLLNLTNSIRDRSAKILTSPTLMVQEGSSSQVNLTQEIFSGVKRETSAVGATGALPTITETPIIRPSGVILNVTVEQIDDNGFLTMKISPEVSAPSGQFEVAGEVGTLLQQRRLETGRMRLRDGQTLIMTGIIQDEDRADVTKVPILGDIPLLGRLFRRDTKSRERRELVVLVTPHIMNDSDQANYGYRYNLSPEAQKLLQPKR
ncbi:Type IV pilus biogenesis protein PilQ [uncultured Synechococcales cyanobacterium]|uniref:Type IV pilus biogenesis protein PilQ n=1 Tax=uncultured Synechococcales cyanobacterium TaxID=1936017 RepID=A0A6J4V499_9CYAN|nr:Type IV pilus biogenesis protein PilQ [uncultured Synechococcales cyanobacterium]